MARIRTIKPEFWRHEGLSALPEATHLLAAALLNYADDEGYFNANPALVKAECSPLREPSVSIQESLTLLSNDGYLELGTGPNGRRYGRILHFSDHQKVNRPSQSKIKALPIVWEGSVRVHGLFNEDSLPEQGTGSREQGKEQGMERGQLALAQTELEPKPDEFEARFSELQAIYPRRSGHQRWPDASKHIRARLREGHTWDEILDGARRYAEWVRERGKERTETVLQAATFVGENKGFLDPWDPPATKADARLAGNMAAADEFMRRTEGTR